MVKTGDIQTLEYMDHPLLPYINGYGITQSSIPDALVVLASGADASPLAAGSEGGMPLSTAVLADHPGFPSFDLQEP